MIIFEATPKGYDLFRNWEHFYSIEYRVEGIVTFEPLHVEIVAESREAAIEWVKKQQPTFIIIE